MDLINTNEYYYNTVRENADLYGEDTSEETNYEPLVFGGKAHIYEEISDSEEKINIFKEKKIINKKINILKQKKNAGVSK